ncbi:MAG TPA: glycosyl transferase [Ruminococcaceae bacterium]|nr:glycosyl transferase [Oscillospiraceae bacterium]
MIWIYNGLIVCWLLFNFGTCMFFLYQLAVSLMALRRQKTDLTKPAEKTHRFAALIAARNEEQVITNLVESIYEQEYPQGMIDVIVVADNCTDHTAEVARKAGAIVYERFNRIQIGKGYVLEFAFNKIFAERDVYDAFCIFDADNLVEKTFFQEMNKALCAGMEVAQGYRDIKNPFDTWVSGCHAIYYWQQNRFSNFARASMGLSASINGTGFMISAEHLRKTGGYHVGTLTEDLEYTMQTVIGGGRVCWVPTARIFDEQPLTQHQSMVQRDRWTNGFLQCMTKYTLPMMAGFFQRPSLIKFDMIMFLLTLPMTLLGAISTGVYGLLTLMGVFPIGSSFLNNAILIVGILGGFAFAAAFSVLLEKPKLLHGLRRSILYFPYFYITWMVIYLKCFFIRSNVWKAIPHVRSLSINEVESSNK